MVIDPVQENQIIERVEEGPFTLTLVHTANGTSLLSIQATPRQSCCSRWRAILGIAQGILGLCAFARYPNDAVRTITVTGGALFSCLLIFKFCRSCRS